MSVILTLRVEEVKQLQPLCWHLQNQFQILYSPDCHRPSWLLDWNSHQFDPRIGTVREVKFVYLSGLRHGGISYLKETMRIWIWKIQ